MKHGIEVNVQINHITTFSKPTLHFRAMRFKIMLCGRPHWGAKEKKGRTGVKDEKDISDSGGGGCAVVGGVCGR